MVIKWSEFKHWDKVVREARLSKGVTDYAMSQHWATLHGVDVFYSRAKVEILLWLINRLIKH